MKMIKTVLKILWITVAVLLAAAVIFVGIKHIRTGSFVAEDKAMAYFIDVGQADSSLITYQGYSVLIDVGKYDFGRVTAEYVRMHTDGVIDYLVITHPHEDHMGGLYRVLKTVDVENLVISDVSVDHYFYRDAIALAEEQGVNIIELSRGAEFDAGPIHIKIIDTFDFNYTDLNDSSMMTRIDIGEASMLFPGDAENYAESYAMFVDRESLDCDLLHVGHHGSYSSTSMNFLKAVSPEVCVISCGRDNEYGHPHRSTLRTLETYGALVYRTDTMGTIKLEIDVGE